MTDYTSETPTKKCTGPCGRVLPATPEYFHRQKQGKHGVTSQCRECRSLYKRAYDTRPEVVARREAVRLAYNARPEIQEHRREYQREYYERNQERIALRDSQPEARERNNHASQKYRTTKKGKEVQRAAKQKRRAQKRHSSEQFTADDVLTQFTAQKGLCWWCGKPLDPQNYHVDHIIPLSKGGSNSPRNICCAHPLCNLSKTDKMPWEFANRLF